MPMDQLKQVYVVSLRFIKSVPDAAVLSSAAALTRSRVTHVSALPVVHVKRTDQAFGVDSLHEPALYRCMRCHHLLL